MLSHDTKLTLWCLAQLPAETAINRHVADHLIRSDASEHDGYIARLVQSGDITADDTTVMLTSAQWQAANAHARTWFPAPPLDLFGSAINLSMLIMLLAPETKLKQDQGRTIYGTCPFHSPSKDTDLMVLMDTRSWTCFGCRAAGVAYDFYEIWRERQVTDTRG